MIHLSIAHMFSGIFYRYKFAMFRGKKLILATNNIHKQKEMDALLNDMDIKIVGLNQYSQVGEIDETGKTLTENSFIKSRTVNKLTGVPSLADDTGLEVDALGGKPGVYSARYAGENPTYEDNVNKLLVELGGLPKEKRTARFRTVVTFVDGFEELFSEGVIEGVITSYPKGEDGFGYDPIFQPKGYSLTFAEMAKNEKNNISHRAQALFKMKKILKQYLEKGATIG